MTFAASLTIALLFIILALHAPRKRVPQMNERSVMRLIRMEARERYIQAYAKTDNSVDDLVTLFDYLIRITDLNGTVVIQDRRQFKQLISEAIINTKYPSASYKAEAAFVFDFVIEAYDVIIGDFHKYEMTFDLRQFAGKRG